MSFDVCYVPSILNHSRGKGRRVQADEEMRRFGPMKSNGNCVR